jgi:hypothetical protein
MSLSVPPVVMLNLFQHNALPLVILKRVQDDEIWLEGAVL